MNNNTDTKTTRWVTFSLNSEIYAINVMQVQEVLKMTEIAPVPGAPNYILGIINLRGNVVAVLDTRTRIGLSEKEFDDSTRIIIVETEKAVIGILVDSVAEVVDIPVDEIESAPSIGSEENSRYIQGVVTLDGQLYILADLEKLLTDDEWQEINAI